MLRMSLRDQVHKFLQRVALNNVWPVLCVVSVQVTPSMIYNCLTSSADGRFVAYAHIGDVILIDLVRVCRIVMMPLLHDAACSTLLPMHLLW